MYRAENSNQPGRIWDIPVNSTENRVLSEIFEELEDYAFLGFGSGLAEYPIAITIHYLSGTRTIRKA